MPKAFVPNHARIMRNTVILYIRMALMMCIGLYTSRVILLALGIEDYGVFSVVWGLVEIFGFINGGMTASTQRFLTFEMGSGNKRRLQEVFITSMNIHIIISLIIFVLSETGGLWFLTEKMVIPDERRTAAMWCFQLSVVTTILEIMSCPYQSVIIAREKISAFAYISILEAILKLAIVGMVLLTDHDRLIIYAILYACGKFLIRLIYNSYCTRHFEESRYKWFFDKALLKKMISFAGWNILGNLFHALNNQGLSLLLNVFFGPIVNAAQAVANQVQHIIRRFSRNFIIAYNPQITKSYASGQLKEMHLLIFRGSRLSFCLLLILCLPLMVEAPMVLDLWLKEVPKGTVNFLRLLLIILIVYDSTYPLYAAISATGEVRKYQLTNGVIMISVLPISFLILKMGGAPWSVYAVTLVFAIIATIATLNIVLEKIHMEFKDYFHHALKPCIIVLLLSLITPYLMKEFTDSGLLNSILTIATTVVSTGILSYMIGLDREMRIIIKERILKKITSFHR